MEAILSKFEVGDDEGSSDIQGVLRDEDYFPKQAKLIGCDQDEIAGATLVKGGLAKTSKRSAKHKGKYIFIKKIQIRCEIYFFKACEFYFWAFSFFCILNKFCQF